MKNKLPIKYENGFFFKIKNFFSNIFRKNYAVVKEKNEIIKENKTEIVNIESEFEKMKSASNKAKIEEDIFTLIEKHPELIETLSIDKLKVLSDICNKIIEENDRQIKKLNRKFYNV